MKKIKKMFIPITIIFLLFLSTFIAGCVETGRSSQTENYLVGKISVTEVTYLWGNDGPFTKQYIVSYQTIGSERQSRTLSKSEYESLINGVGGYVLPDFGIPAPSSTSLPSTIQPKLTTNSQEKIYQDIENSTENIQMIGNVYGLASNPAVGIDEIDYAIHLSPGAPTIDLTKMKITFSTSNTNPIILTQGGTVSETVFTTKLVDNTPVTSMDVNQNVIITFKTVPIKANTKMTIVTKPVIGAALSFTKTAPSTILKTNLLY
jgi:archaeal flagellin FlaB